MTDASKEQLTCARCGKAYAASAGACPECETGGKGDDTVAADVSEWKRVRDSLKLKWVAAVLAFWVSAAVLVTVLLIDDRIDLTLTSISLGMLVIGVWLKTRYRLAHAQGSE